MPDIVSGLNGTFQLKLSKSIMTSDTRISDDVKSISEPHQSGPEPPSSQCVSNTRSRAQNLYRSTNAVHLTENVSREDSGASPDKAIPKGCALGQRTSIRISKRPKREPSPPPATQAQPPARKGVSKQNLQLKTRRAWELWSVEDKNAFFEALCEYGKNFESIQSYIAQRSRKKGIPPNMIKNKDQVRFFYYRTWHKISKYLDIGDDVKKRTQELYGLINYAELRKKIGGCLSDKNRLQLNELVFSGVTFIKYRGKKLRIKTPVCRALKRLNNVEESKEPEVQKMPKEVVIEFRPHNNGAWSHVHNLAQNPRVRTKLSLQRRLKAVIEYLQRRWKPYRLRQKEQIIANAGNSDLLITAEPVPLLHVRPKQDAVISFLEISTTDVASSIDVCLKNHQKNIVNENIADKEPIRKGKSLGKMKNKNEMKTSVLGNKEQIKSNPDRTGKLEKINDDVANHHTSLASSSVLSTNNEKSENSENPVFEAERSLTLLKGMLNSVQSNSCETKNCDKSASNTLQIQVDDNVDIVDEIYRRDDSETADGKADVVDTSNCRSIEEIYLNTQQDAENMTLGQLLGLATVEKNNIKHDGHERIIELNSPDFLVNCNSTVNNITTSTEKTDADCQTKKAAIEERIQTIRKGWTVETVGTLSVGELYLMLGSPEKIILEYSWDHSDSSQKPSTNKDTVEKPVSENVEELQNLSIVLQKLLQVASMTFMDFKTKQQEPLSPTCRSNVRSAATPPAGKINASRSSTRSPNVRSGIRGSHQNSGVKCSAPKPVDSHLESSSSCQNSTKSDGDKTCNPNQVPTSSSDSLHQDKHVFVVPVGTAPRTIKQPVIASPDAIREQLDKFLPAQRRGGSRMRTRKPLVVQRPLLPRGGIGPLEGPRPMTVVHLVPSSSQITPLTAVIPSTSSCNVGTNKVVLPQTKKVVKLLPPGTPVDMQSIPVPILKSVGNSSGGVVLPTSNISTGQMVVSTSTATSTLETSASDVTSSQQHITSSLLPILSSENPVVSHEVKGESLSSSSVHKSSVINTPATVSIEGVPLKVLSSTVKSPSVSNICITTTCSSSPPQISIPENTSPSSISPPNISSILEMSLSEGEYANLPTETIPGPGSEHLLGFNENSDSSLSAAFGLPSSLSSNKTERNISSVPTCIPSCLSSNPVVDVRQGTPPHSPPPSGHFRICSPVPDNHWLNGESGDFSLSSLLNTLESPCKPAPVIPSMNITTDSSNLDPIARLAPDVDTQLQCLMNESSIDYVAKFADLAAQIASTSSTETKST